jgi:hypothetical protein
LGLTLLTTDVHALLSRDLVLHIFTPTFLKSSSTLTSRLNIGLPIFLYFPGLPSTNFLTILSPSILTICPSHYSLHSSNTVTISGDLKLLYIN